MDAGDASQPITQSAEDAQASSVICKEETDSRDLPDSSTSAHLGDCPKDEDAEKKASSRNLFSNTNAGPFISVNHSGSVQFIPCQQRYETFSSWPGSPIMQYAVHSRNGTYIVSDNKGQATPGGMSAYQISSPASGLSQVMDSSPNSLPSSLPSPQKLAVEASQKRELRLMKNRTAAKEYRRRQKDYVRSLETRIAMMENQKRKMTEELDSLKELCTGKSHSF